MLKRRAATGKRSRTAGAGGHRRARGRPARPRRVAGRGRRRRLAAMVRRRDARRGATSPPAATCSGRIGIAGASLGANLAALAAAGDAAGRQPRAAVAVARLSRAAHRAGGAEVRRPAGAARRQRRRRVRARSPRAAEGRRRNAGAARRRAAPGTGRHARRATRISRARWWTGFAERCYDRRRPGSRAQRIRHLRRRRHVLRPARRLDYRQPAGAAPRAAAACGAPPARSRPAAGRQPPPPLDEARAAALQAARRAAIRAMPQRASQLGNLYFDAERSTTPSKWYEEALKIDPQERQREHRPRHRLLLHEPAGSRARSSSSARWRSIRATPRRC